MDSSPLPKRRRCASRQLHRSEGHFRLVSRTTLNLKGYLNEPETGWNRTTASRTGREDDAACSLHRNLGQPAIYGLSMGFLVQTPARSMS